MYVLVAAPAVAVIVSGYVADETFTLTVRTSVVAPNVGFGTKMADTPPASPPIASDTVGAAAVRAWKPIGVFVVDPAGAGEEGRPENGQTKDSGLPQRHRGRGRGSVGSETGGMGGGVVGAAVVGAAVGGGVTGCAMVVGTVGRVAGRRVGFLLTTFLTAFLSTALLARTVTGRASAAFSPMVPEANSTTPTRRETVRRHCLDEWVVGDQFSMVGNNYRQGPAPVLEKLVRAARR